jgi:hypothetical protein
MVEDFERCYHAVSERDARSAGYRACKRCRP